MRVACGEQEKRGRGEKRVRESFFGCRSPSVRELSVVGGVSKQNKDGKGVNISLYRPTNSVVD
jgi:hypothetical protein